MIFSQIYCKFFFIFRLLTMSDFRSISPDQMKANGMSVDNTEQEQYIELKPVSTQETNIGPIEVKQDPYVENRNMIFQTKCEDTTGDIVSHSHSHHIDTKYEPTLAGNTELKLEQDEEINSHNIEATCDTSSEEPLLDSVRLHT